MDPSIQENNERLLRPMMNEIEEEKKENSSSNLQDRDRELVE